MDEIIIKGLTVFAHHGVLAHETALGQPFVVDVTVGVDTRAAAASDNLDETLDYGTVAQAIAGLVAGEPVRLIETLAENIARLVLEAPKAETVTVTVTKPHAPLGVLAEHVAVRIVRP